MRHYSPSPPLPTDEHSVVELYLRIGKEIFGVSFLSLDEAKKAARTINRTGRSVEIFEKISGKVLERTAGWTEKRPLEAPPITTRPTQKSHQFETGASYCSSCGLSLLDSLSLPTPCTGMPPAFGTTDQPIGEVVDTAE